jgi:hypothetical protein
MIGNNRPRIGQELLDVPMGDMIRQMAFAIAEAQIVLDQNSIDVAEMMGGLRTITDGLGNVTFEDSRVFFGTEKVRKSDAIERHNSIKSIQQKAEIRIALGQAAYHPTIQTITNFDPTTNPTPIQTDKYVEYSGAYYVKDGTTSKQIAYEDFTITSIDTASDANIVELPRRISMLECGFTPTFYQFVDTIIEVKISIKYTQEGESTISRTQNNNSSSVSLGFGFAKVKAGKTVQTSQVNASYSQKYSYSAEGSSLLRTKLVPIPPPAVLEQRIQRLLDEEFPSGNTTTA